MNASGARWNPWTVRLAPAFLAAMAMSAAGANVWTGSGNWNTPSNWSDGHVPVEGEEVLVDGFVTLTNPTASLASYTLAAGRTNLLDGWETRLAAESVTVYGTLTHATNTATATNALGVWVPTARVLIECGSLSIPASGRIDVSGRGFRGGVQTNGFGPGGGGTEQERGGGGGYGGRGTTASSARGGSTYGSSEEPDLPGSGGGGVPKYAGSTGGAGGGLVRILASGSVSLDGAIKADGVNGITHCPGAGSGGGVYIRCATVSGSGAITATGGVSFVGGGGGRIAVAYTNAAAQALLSPALQFDALSNLGGGTAKGDPGTLHLPDASFYPAETVAGSCQMVIPGFTNWNPSSLTIQSGEPRFPEGMRLDVANHVTVRPGGALWLTNGNLSCGGNLVVTGGSFTLYSAATNDGGPAYGSAVDVAGNLVVATNSTVYPVSHPFNGGSVRFAVGGDIRILAGGRIMADSAGFGGGFRTNGFGPGGGKCDRDRGGGGGYGGRGSKGYLAEGGASYGSDSLPLMPGSGGGGATNSTGYGGNGGGLIWLEAEGGVMVNGILSANGASASGPSGGGSGGGVYIRSGTVDGTGWIMASGGVTYVAGGGGRIAIAYTNTAAQDTLSPSVQFSAATVKGNGEVPGEPGSLSFPDTRMFPYSLLQGGYLISIPTLADWAPENLVISNGEIRFPAGYALAVSNELRVQKGGILLLTNASLACGGDLVLTNGGQMHLYSGPTNGTGPAYGGRVGVDGAFRIATGSTCFVWSNPTNGGSLFFDVGSLCVMSNGTIDANARGYAGGTNRGVNGWGPGGGIGHFSSDRGGGGGYGGVGATFSNSAAYGGTNYGAAILPLQAGSGGGGKNGFIGGAGGGLVWMRVRGPAVVDGLITANGTNLAALVGGGSGGGVFLDCGAFGGRGRITANGGTFANAMSAGGGGGRIAIWQGATDAQRESFAAGNLAKAVISDTLPAFSGSLSAANGLYGFPAATPGTARFLTAVKSPGTLIMLR